MRSIADSLRAARRRIETPEQWLKGRYLAERGTACCVAWAIQTSAFDSVQRGAMNKFFRRAIGVKGEMGDIGRWNDAPERTHAEVLAALDRAIELAEAEQ